MRQNLEKNVEKIVAITLSVGLATMNVGSSPKKIVKSVSDSSLPLVNLSTVSTDITDYSNINNNLEYSDFNTDLVRSSKKEVKYDSSNHKNEKNVSKNTGVIRVSEINFNGITDYDCKQNKLDDTNTDFDHDNTGVNITGDVIDDASLDSDFDQSVYELDPLEEDLENTENNSDLDANEIVPVEKEDNKNNVKNDETEKIEISKTDENLNCEPISEEKELESVETEDKNDSETQELNQDINTTPTTTEFVNGNESDVSEETVEQEQEPELKNNENLAVENPPQIITTPFGTRIVAREGSENIDSDSDKKEKEDDKNTGVSDEQTTTEEIKSTDSSIDSDSTENQNKQVVNSQNNTYPSTIYRTLDDIPEEGVNGMSKSTIMALMAAGIPLAVILLTVGYNMLG